VSQVEIAAKTVDIVEARETDAGRFVQKSKQSGLTVSISNPVISAVPTVQQMKKATGDEGGHLIASAQGGAGDQINIVPQDRTLNRGAWRDMEKYLKQELDAGKSVTTKIEAGYPPDGGLRGRVRIFV
jgi:hypothetical protein